MIGLKVMISAENGVQKKKVNLKNVDFGYKQRQSYG